MAFAIRQLRFETSYFSITTFCRSFAELESKHEFVVKVRDLVKAWPRPTFIVMRYLFAFLNHLSEFRYFTLGYNLFFDAMIVCIIIFMIS